MVGSIEKAESSRQLLPDFLPGILKHSDESEFRDIDDRIALQCLSRLGPTDISGKPFEIHTLNEMPAYLEVFQCIFLRVH